MSSFGCLISVPPPRGTDAQSGVSALDMVTVANEVSTNHFTAVHNGRPINPSNDLCRTAGIELRVGHHGFARRSEHSPLAIEFTEGSSFGFFVRHRLVSQSEFRRISSDPGYDARRLTVRLLRVDLLASQSSFGLPDVLLPSVWRAYLFG